MSAPVGDYAARCRAAVDAVGLPFLAALVGTSQGVPDYVRLVREAVKATAPKTALPADDEIKQAAATAATRDDIARLRELQDRAALEALADEVKTAHAAGTKYYRDHLVSKYGPTVGDDVAGELIDFTVAELDRAAEAEVVETRATAGGDMARLESAAADMLAAFPTGDALVQFIYRGPRGAVKIDDAAVADYLYERHATVSFNDKIYVYEDGTYGPDKGTVSGEVKRFIRECGTHEQLTRVLREVTAHLLATNPFTTQPFNLATNLIPVANGVISIDYETGRPELLDHSPGYRFNYKLPVTFDPDATPADALALLSQYVAPEDVPLLVQPFAQALLQTQLNKTYKKNYLIQGNRDAAKSTYTLILEGFFGPENISHVSLQSLTTDRFCKGRMENKLINYFDDLDAVPLSQIGMFKALTGSTTHDIERKFESGYAGRIVCPHVFTCNRPPRVADDAKTDDAWWGRWEYVRFPYSFPIDPTFPDRTLTPAFYSSLLAAVLAMMIEIRQNGSLTINRTPAEVQRRWNVMSDPLFQFIDAKMERLAATVNDFDKGKLFRAYLIWCEDTGIPMGLRIQTTTAFTQALEPYGILAIETSKKIDGRKRDYKVYRGGYRWKNDNEDMGFDFGPFMGGAT